MTPDELAQVAPTPWRVFSVYAQPEIRDANDKLVVQCPPYQERLARRIADCMNFLAEVDTQAIDGKSLAEYVSSEAFLQGLIPTAGGLSLGISGLAAQVLASSFAGQFVGSGAVNFLEINMSHEEIGEFTVTLQRKQGATPGEMKSAALAELERQKNMTAELLVALIELRDWYQENTGLPACRANAAIQSEMKGSSA